MFFFITSCDNIVLVTQQLLQTQCLSLQYPITVILYPQTIYYIGIIFNHVYHKKKQQYVFV